MPGVLPHPLRMSLVPTALLELRRPGNHYGLCHPLTLSFTCTVSSAVRCFLSCPLGSHWLECSIDPQLGQGVQEASDPLQPQGRLRAVVRALTPTSLLAS